MDDFVKATGKTIGPGGLKCPCCNDYRTFGCHGKKTKPGLSKLRRSRLKQNLQKEINQIDVESIDG